MKGRRPVGFYVAARRCGECLFSKDKIVSDARRREVLAQCERTGRFFVCHKDPLDGGPPVCCRGFFEARDSVAVEIAKRLNAIVPIEVEGES